MNTSIKKNFNFTLALKTRSMDARIINIYLVINHTGGNKKDGPTTASFVF